MDRAQRLGEGSIPRLLLTFSAPAIVGMVAQALYNVVDRIFIGRNVGADGIAGATVAFPFMLIIMAFGMLIGYGATASISIRLGQKKKDEAEKVLGNAALLMVVISLVLTVVGLTLIDPVLRTLGASDRILPFARSYLQIVILGAVVQTVGFGLNAVIRGEGNPRIAMITMLIGALLNTILDYIFLRWFGWGMRGAAAATVLSQSVSAIWVLSYFLGGRSLLKIRGRNLRLERATCATIVALGSPLFAMQLAASVLNALLNNQLSTYGDQIGPHGGDLAISVMGVVYAVLMFIAMPVFGLNQGAQPIIGYNYGARRYDRVKKTLLTAILAATTVTCTGFFVAMVFPSQVVWLFTDPNDPDLHNPELLQLGAHALRVCMLMWPIVGFQIVSTSYFHAVGKPKRAMLLSLSRQALLLFPAVLILPYFFGLNGLWAALPTADFLSSLWTGIWLAVELRHLRRGHAQTVADKQVDASPLAEQGVVAP